MTLATGRIEAEAGTTPHLSTGVLPSGRSIVVTLSDGQERLEIRDPGGEVEVRVLLTTSGPVVELRGARLAIESADTVAVHCRRLELLATEGADLHSEGDVRITGREVGVKTENDIRLDGAKIRLNCEPTG